jgi:acetoin utilization protein AcuB
MIVKDYMTPAPLVVSIHEHVDRISELIRRHGIKQVPVVDESNRLVGIVTDRDIRSAVAYDEENELELLAEDIMSTELFTVTPGEQLIEAARLLHDHNFGSLPVVIGDHIVGIITTKDLLYRLIELLEPQADDVEYRRSTTKELGQREFLHDAFTSLRMERRVHP